MGASCSLPEQGASRCGSAARVLADDRHHPGSYGLRAASSPEAPRRRVAVPRARDYNAASTVPGRANALCGLPSTYVSKVPVEIPAIFRGILGYGFVTY